MLITNETMTHLIERSNEEREIDNMIDFEMRKHLMEHKKKTSSQHSPPIGKAINKPTEKEGPVQEIDLIDLQPETKENSEILMLDENELDVRIEKLEKLLKKKEKEIRRKQKKKKLRRKQELKTCLSLPLPLPFKQPSRRQRQSSTQSGSNHD
jgi:hypothetical protein